MLKSIMKIGLGFFLLLMGFTNVWAAYTWSADYVWGVTIVWEGQYSTFLELVNSPIGYLIMFILGLAFLKYVAKEIKGFTPGSKGR